MKKGVIFPQLEIGTDPQIIKEYAQTAEQLGYDHILVYDHVLGADPRSHPGWNGKKTHKDMFHEVFVLLGYLAAVTTQIELAMGVLVSPQRQTALIAKQAAEVDILSKGRFRLGIGVGWNKIEFEGLGENFHNRGKRIEEQVHILRALWSKKIVNFEGNWHHIKGSGINPLPVQDKIPIWMGGRSNIVLRRIAKLADGWFPQYPPNKIMQEKLHDFWRFVNEAGRKRSDLGIEARINIGNKGEKNWLHEVANWEKLGATHLTLNTMNSHLALPEDHLKAIKKFKDEIG